SDDNMRPRGSMAALTMRFVQQDRGGDRGVQRFDRRLHRNGDTLIGRIDERRWEAWPFAADKYRRGTAHVDVEDSGAVPRDGRDDAAVARAKQRDDIAEIRHDLDGQSERAPHRSSERFPAVRIG